MRRGIIKILHGGRPGVIVGEIYCHQQSIKGDYRKLTVNEKEDHKNIRGDARGL